MKECTFLKIGDKIININSIVFMEGVASNFKITTTHGELNFDLNWHKNNIKKIFYSSDYKDCTQGELYELLYDSINIYFTHYCCGEFMEYEENNGSPFCIEDLIY